jgi:glucose/arabinose dehydrogenase/anti-sigma factor RsiW
MTEHLSEERLHGFVDGALDPEERDAVARHLATCETCRREVEAMTALVADARALPRAIDPARDLWPGIGARLVPSRRVPLWLAAAAVIALAVATLLWRANRTKASEGWLIAAAEGRPSVASGQLRPGQELVTDAASQVRLRVGTIGTVDVGPETRVRLLASRKDEQRLALAHGTIEARIVAPARVFLVETPAALAVDLGCVYTLTTDSLGNGLLHVTSGWVELRNGSRLTVVPRDAYATIRAGLGPGTAYGPDASPALKRALEDYDFSDDRDESFFVRTVVGATAQRSDGVTLLNVLSAVDDSLRPVVFDRLVALVPPPPGVTRAGVLALDRRMINRWWDELVPPRIERDAPGPKGSIRPSVQGQLRVERVVRGLAMPLHLTAPAGDPRLFIVEQEGRIRIVKNGALVARPFLDIAAKIASGGERGLLSLAFHPRYAENGFFYVNYTDLEGDTRVERYTVTSDPDVAAATSGVMLLTIEQPYPNHNGGHILFGLDGMLYVGMGDGGSGGDPHGYGQSRNTLLGKLLRIDPSLPPRFARGDPPRFARGDSSGQAPYAVPRDNPFVDSAGIRPEIWAYGLRNPWRMAFDRPTGLLYIADVGQSSWEEVNVQPAAAKGLNYGWNRMEGNHCYGLPVCRKAGLVVPALEYSHDDGCSITGGVVYRGKALPFLVGHYLYSDYCTGFLRSFTFGNGAVTGQRYWDVGSIGSVLSFGEDGAGEVYVLSSNGAVYRIVEKR